MIFNKNVAGFVDLLAKVPDVFTAHRKFRKSLEQQGSGEWRYVFSSPEDEIREVTIHVYLFNLFVGAAKPATPKKAGD